MKSLLASLLLLAPLSLGCGSSTPSEPSVDRSQNPVAGAAGVGNPAATIDQVKVKMDLANLRQTIKFYHQANESYPPRSELDQVQTEYRIGVEYDYDASTGVIRSRTYPNR